MNDEHLMLLTIDSNPQVFNRFQTNTQGKSQYRLTIIPSTKRLFPQPLYQREVSP